MSKAEDEFDFGEHQEKQVPDASTSADPVFPTSWNEPVPVDDPFKDDIVEPEASGIESFEAALELPETETPEPVKKSAIVKVEKHDIAPAQHFAETHKKPLMLGAGAVILLIAIIIGWMTISGLDGNDKAQNGSSGPQVNQSQPQTPSTESSPPPAPVATETGAIEKEGVAILVEGDKHKGNHNTGTDAISGYDQGYYKLRNADVASSFFLGARAKQESIDKNVAKGATYRAEVTPVIIGEKYEVKLTLIVGKAEGVHNQTIYVKNENGKYFVTDIVNK